MPESNITNMEAQIRCLMSRVCCLNYNSSIKLFSVLGTNSNYGTHIILAMNRERRKVFLSVLAHF